MPLAKRKSGEDRNTFVSRCIREETAKANNMTHEMIVAACENAADMSTVFMPLDEYLAMIKSKK